jgi:hypothetical protein
MGRYTIMNVCELPVVYCALLRRQAHRQRQPGSQGTRVSHLDYHLEVQE